MSLPREDADEPAEFLVPRRRIRSVEWSDTPGEQSPSRVVLGLGCELLECLLGKRSGDALLAEFTAKSCPAERLCLAAAAHPHPCELRVIDEAHVLEPCEERGRHSFGHVAITELLLELVPAPGTEGQLTQQDGAGNRLGIGVLVLLRRRGPLRAPVAGHLVPVDGLEARLLLILGVLLDPHAELLLDEPLEFLGELGVVPKESA